MSWEVKLVKPTRDAYFKQGFFPRKFHYKREALELQSEVQTKGGVAVVENVKSRRHERLDHK